MDKFHIYEEISCPPSSSSQSTLSPSATTTSTSQVYKGRERSTIQYVAIKRVDKSLIDLVSTSVGWMHRMSSPNVVRFVDWYETRNNLWIITEYCPGGALRRVLQDDKRLPESSIRGFMVDIIRGLFHAHMTGVVLGCGISPDGVLLDEFGVSKLNCFKHASRRGGEGMGGKEEEELKYEAPENIKEIRGGEKGDMWALGVCMYEMFFGATPFGGGGLERMVCEMEVTWTVVGEGRGDVLDRTANTTGASWAFRNIVAGMLKKDPMERLGWMDIVGHEFWEGGLDDLKGKVEKLPANEAWEGKMIAYLESKDWDATDAKRKVEGARKAKVRGRGAGGENYGEIKTKTDIWGGGLISEGDEDGEEDEGEETFDGSEVSEDAIEALAESNMTSISVVEGLNVIEATGVSGFKDGREVDELSETSLTGAAGNGENDDTLEESIRTPSPTEDGASMEMPPLNSLIYTNQDFLPRPIYPTVWKGDGGLDLRWSKGRVPVDVRSREEVKAMTSQALEQYFGRIYKTLSSCAESQKEGVYRFMYELCDLEEVANLVGNSSFLKRVIKDARGGGGATAVAGRVFRHASYLHYDPRVVKSLKELYRNTKGVYRKVAAAALGEVVFYSRSQGKEEGWTALGLEEVEDMVRDGDRGVREVGCRVVENCMAVGQGGGGGWIGKVKEEGDGVVAQVFCGVLAGGAKKVRDRGFIVDRGEEDGDREERRIRDEVERLEFRERLEGGIKEGNTRSQVTWCNVLNVTLWCSKGRTLAAMTNIINKANILDELFMLSERGATSVLRGKATIAIILCARNDGKALEKIARKERWMKSLSQKGEYGKASIGFLRDIAKNGISDVRILVQNKNLKVKDVQECTKVLRTCVPILSSRIIKKAGGVDGAFVRNVGWGLNWREGGEDWLTAVLGVAEVLVEDESVRTQFEMELIDSVVPNLIRLLDDPSNVEGRLVTLSLLRLCLPGMFVGGGKAEVLRRLGASLLEVLPGAISSQDSHISQYSLLLLSELCGATGSLLGRGQRSVWEGCSRLVARGEVVRCLVDKINDGGKIANCLLSVMENGYKETVGLGETDLPPVVRRLLEEGIAVRACEALSRNGEGGALGWLNVIKCLVCVVTSSMPKESSETNPLESPPPGKAWEEREDAWGSTILSPGDVQSMNLKTPDSKGRGNSDYLMCRKCLEDMASFGSLFVTVMRVGGEERKKGVEDAASYILAALAKLSGGNGFFKGLIEFRREGKGALKIMRDMLIEAMQSEEKYSRCVVRLLRVLGLGEEMVVKEVSKDKKFVDVLTRMAMIDGRGENGKEVVVGATSMCNRCKFSER